MLPDSDKIKKYIEILDIFVKENDKLVRFLPSQYLTISEFAAWSKNPDNKIKLKKQREVVDQIYLDLLQAWKDLCKDINNNVCQ